MDLGAGTNKAAEIERYFDDLTTLDEKAAATTAGKITELLINIGIPGGIGFKVGKTLARKALLSKRAGNYFKVGDGKELANAAKKAAELNTKGRSRKIYSRSRIRWYSRRSVYRRRGENRYLWRFIRRSYSNR